nr:hypothetical protein BaRGS_033142 [Batillaria attramentaria]
MGQNAAKQNLNLIMRVTVRKGNNWLLFKRPEVIDHSVKDQMDKWHQIQQKIITTAFSGRPATVFVRLPQHENLSQVLKMPPGSLRTVDNTHYELYTRQDSFDDSQLTDIADSVGFELSSLWIGGQVQGGGTKGEDDDTQCPVLAQPAAWKENTGVGCRAIPGHVLGLESG